MMLREVIGKRLYTPLIPAQLHTAFCAQKSLASFQYVLAARQKQSGYEQKQLLRKERGEAAWLTKNRKYNSSLRICSIEKLFPVNS